jgi:deazaflavin-dependent oxidoreductase (nitroreductase family)
MLNQKRVARQSNVVVRRWPRAQRAMGRAHARLYRWSGGRFVPRWFAGAPVMVLETVGRKSGQRRRTPVLYLRDGEALVVLAANAGSQRMPAWWLNLRDAGEAEVVVGRRRRRVRPRVLEGAERERLWRAFVEMYPQAEHYTEFTDRELPLVALEPVGDAAAGEDG